MELNHLQAHLRILFIYIKVLKRHISIVGEKGCLLSIKVECYRWIEHGSVSEDWNLGYRNKKELDEWLKLIYQQS